MAKTIQTTRRVKMNNFIFSAFLSYLKYKSEALCDLYRYRKVRNKIVEIYRKIYELL